MCTCRGTDPPIGKDLCFEATGRKEFVANDLEDRPLSLLENHEVFEENGNRQRLDAGAEAQLLTLYDKYRRPLLRYMHFMRLQRDQAEEIIQETFVRLTKELVQEKDIENVQGWIIRVAHNMAVDAIKKRDKEEARFIEITDFGLESWIDPALNPEEIYMDTEQTRRMKIALSTLSPQQRQCFQMRAEGLRYKDIGVALGISEQRAAFVVRQAAVRLAAICG
jgi:RNA polymerase sigma-70 factor (ECF subfamily)